MIKFTDIKNKIKPGNLTFLVLTISLVLSSVVIPNDIVDYGNANVPNASHVGSRNFNIKFNETQSIVYDTKNVTINKGGTSGFDVNYTGWVSEYIDMKVSNITDKESHNLVRQDLANASTNRTIPMYGTNYTLVDGGNTYEFKPQEVGTNFVLDSPAYISNVYLALGFHILYNGTHDNLAETKNMINNATIEIRKDQSDTPVIDQHIKSIPLRDCIVNWTEDAEYINQTIGNAIDTNPKHGMLPFAIIRVPFNFVLEASTLIWRYYTVFNSTASHQFNMSNVADFHIDLYTFDDGGDNTHFAFRTNDSIEFKNDLYFTYVPQKWDIYHIIEMRILDYSDPYYDIGFLIEDWQMTSWTKYHTFVESIPNYRVFECSAVNAPVGLSFLADVNATVKRSTSQMQEMVFSTDNNSVQWSGLMPLSSPHENCINRNTTLEIPIEWDIDTLDLRDQNGTVLVPAAINGRNVTLINTESIIQILFSVSSVNVIAHMLDIAEVVNLSTTITIKCFGNRPGKHLIVELYCNNSRIACITDSGELDVAISYRLPVNYSEGSGYTVRAFWDDGSTFLGYLESNSFEFVHIGTADIDEPDTENPTENPNNPLSNFDLSTGTVVGIVALIAALSAFQVLKKGKKKIPKLAKPDVAKTPDDGNIDDWF